MTPAQVERLLALLGNDPAMGEALKMGLVSRADLASGDPVRLSRARQVLTNVLTRKQAAARTRMTVIPTNIHGFAPTANVRLPWKAYVRPRMTY